VTSREFGFFYFMWITLLRHARHQLIVQLYHSHAVASWAGLLAGQGCWLGRVAGWAGLLAGQGCWLGRVSIVEAATGKGEPRFFLFQINVYLIRV